MPSSILSRFKRSPSDASSLSAQSDDTAVSPSKSAFRRSLSPFKPSPELVETSDTVKVAESPISPTNPGPGRQVPAVVENGSHFVEEFADNQTQVLDHTGRPRGQTLPALGTPKLVLTEDGASSPISFGSSPKSDKTSLRPTVKQRPSKERLGLGIDAINEVSRLMSRAGCSARRVRLIILQNDIEVEEDLKTARADTAASKQNQLDPTMSTPADVVSIASAPPASGNRDGRDRSNSAASNNDLRHVKSGSAFGTKASGASSLKPPDSKKSKKSRRLSTSSKHGIAAALAKGGIALAHGHAHLPNGDPIMSTGNKSAPSSRRGSKRNPYLKSSHRPDGDAGSDAALEFDDEDEEDEDDDESDLEGLLPVTGFAVASNRRNVEFHSMFPAVDEGDYLIEGASPPLPFINLADLAGMGTGLMVADYGCALSKDILVQGRLYVSENHVCFHANIFGWVTDVSIVVFTVSPRLSLTCPRLCSRSPRSRRSKRR